MASPGVVAAATRWVARTAGVVEPGGDGGRQVGAGLAGVVGDGLTWSGRPHGVEDDKLGVGIGGQGDC